MVICTVIYHQKIVLPLHQYDICILSYTVCDIQQIVLSEMTTVVGTECKLTTCAIKTCHTRQDAFVSKSKATSIDIWRKSKNDVCGTSAKALLKA